MLQLRKLKRSHQNECNPSPHCKSNVWKAYLLVHLARTLVLASSSLRTAPGPIVDAIHLEIVISGLSLRLGFRWRGSEVGIFSLGYGVIRGVRRSEGYFLGRLLLRADNLK